MRLDQYVSFTLNLSRKDSKEIIKKKNIFVNDNLVIDSSFKVNDTDIVRCKDQILKYEEFIYLLMNKPKGYLSATYDPKDPTVLDLIDGYDKYDLFPIGRLDKDSTGLLLISNDGNLSHNLLSPSKHVSKTYEVISKYNLSNADIDKVKNGIMMDDKLTNPINISKISDKKYQVIISDGKFHEVKRIFEYLNNEVIELKRIKMGNLSLPEDLEEGKYIKLDKDSIYKIF